MKFRQRPIVGLPLLAACVFNSELLAEFTAFNDVASGPATHPNTTTYWPRGTASGFLKDIATGDETAVTLTVTESGVSFENQTATHAAGTDAAAIFGGFVDFSSQSGNSLAVSGGDTFTYTFTGLDPASRYEFVGTACRGNSAYDNRWARVSIEGAESFEVAHSDGEGIITDGLGADEVLFWSGANHEADQGWVVQWTDIVPGADGTFAVVSRQHSGATPFGTADGSKGYALNGIRLKESFIVGQPLVANGVASGVTTGGATLNGEVTDPGAGTPTVTVYWGDEDGGARAGGWDEAVVLGQRGGAFSTAISGLSPATRYYFRAYAENGVAGSWGTPTAEFTTSALPPAVETGGTVGTLLGTVVTVAGEVTETGGILPEVTLFYGADDGGTEAGAWASSVDVGVRSGAMEVLLEGLTPGTGYSYRFRVSNTGGTTWAPSGGSFVTPVITLPAVENRAATGITGISAVLGGEVTGLGADPPAVTIYYGRTDGGEVAGDWEAFVETGIQSGGFNRFVGNLVPESTYFFRVSASNGAGSVWAGSSGSFVTPVYIPPTLVINEIHYDESDKTVRAEFVEVHNLSDDLVDVSGWTLGGGVSFTIPDGTTVPSGGFLVLAENPATVQSEFGRAGALGPWTGSLRNSGENVTLNDRSGNRIDLVDYKLGFPWPTVGDEIGGASPSIQLINPLLENDLGGSWRSARPTPGAANSVLAGSAPPAVRRVEFEVPGREFGRDETVRPGEDVVVTAKVSDAEGVAAVSLDYQLVDPGDYIKIDDGRYNSRWTTVAMSDDGTGGDELAGDGVYSVTLDGASNTHRRLVRYRIGARDVTGNQIRVPYADDPVPNFAYFVYGTMPTWAASARPGSTPEVTYDFAQMEPVAVYQLLTTRSEHVESQSIPGGSGPQYRGSDYRWQGTLVYDGKVYDHIRFRARGGVWRYSMGKNMWKFDFNRGHRFEARDDFGKKYKAEWNKLNFSALIQQGNFRQRGEQGLFEGAGFKNHNLSGSPAPLTHYVHFRIIEHANENGPTSSQFDTDFQGLYMAIEQLDGQFTDQHDLPDGYLWKIEGNNNQTPANNQGAYLESSLPNGDVDDFISSYRNGSPSAAQWKQQLDLDGYYNFRANATWVHDYDIHAGKNYFFFHNPETDKWQVVNWDLDLTWTTTYGGGGTRGPLSDDVLGIPEFALGYRNQVRHLQDLLHNPEQQGMLLDEVAHWVYTPGQPSMVDADRAMWDYNPILSSGFVNSSKAGHGRYYEDATTPRRTFAGMVAKLKSYVAGRRSFMTSNYLNADESRVPRKPTVTFTGAAGFPINDLSFTSSAFSSPSGASFAAQRWRISEITLPSDPRFDPADPLYDRYAERLYEIDAEWESGDVVTTEFAATVPTDAVRPGRLYRVRTKMLDTEGRWGRWSDPVEFVATAPDVSEYTDNLWITEFMYHPPEPSGGELAVSTDQDDFEFIELKNVGTQVLDLRDVRFTKGVDFDFGGSAIEELAPGAFVLVVKDRAAFEARYGGGLPVAGEYGGDSLSNGGERLKLSFGAGVAIHDIDPYDDTAPWPVAADGAGASLVLVAGDGGATPDHAEPGNWRASSAAGGTPGSDEADPGGGYAAWKVANGVVDDFGDEDGDGLLNVFEFFFAGDVLAPTRGVLPEVGVSGGAGTVVLTRRENLGGMIYVMEVTGDLVNWTDAGGAESMVANGDGTVTEQWSLGTGEARWVRVRVTMP